MSDQTAPDSTNGAPNSTDALADVLRQLTTDQIRFVVARHELSSDKAAAQQIGISPETVKNWKYGGAPIDEATRLMALDGIIVARDLRRRNLAKAMLVKVDGLDSKSERTKQAVASEIIEWEMGKATQPSKIDALIRTLDFSELSFYQIERLAEGEDILSVLTNPGTG